MRSPQEPVGQVGLPRTEGAGGRVRRGGGGGIPGWATEQQKWAPSLVPLAVAGARGGSCRHTPSPVQLVVLGAPLAAARRCSRGQFIRSRTHPWPLLQTESGASPNWALRVPAPCLPGQMGPQGKLPSPAALRPPSRVLGLTPPRWLALTGETRRVLSVLAPARRY